MLLAAGADLHAKNDEALRFASMEGHAEVVRLLLAAGAEVHANDDLALRKVSKRGWSHVVRLLLDAGADVHAKDDQALLSAVKFGHDCCQSFEEGGVNRINLVQTDPLTQL